MLRPNRRWTILLVPLITACTKPPDERLIELSERAHARQQVFMNPDPSVEDLCVQESEDATVFHLPSEN